MAFSSCDSFDSLMGYVLITLAFLLSIFEIDAYNKLPSDDKHSRVFQVTVASITLALTLIWFLYLIKDPVIQGFKKLSK